MAYVLEIIGLVALIMSVPGNLFIFVVTLKEWFKNKRLCVTHQLVGGISLWSVLNALLDVILYTYNKVMASEDIRRLKKEISMFLFFFVMSCNLWFSTWLCVHFCLKTVDINQRVYIYLRRMFHKVVPWITLSSVLLSVLFSISMNWYTVNISSQNSTRACSSTFCSHIWYDENSRFNYTLAVNIIVIHVAFILFFSSGLTCVVFLCRHMKRVRDHAGGFSLSSVEFHVRAIRTITCLFSLNSLNFIAMVCYVVEGPNAIITYLAFILVSVCNVVASFTIIKGIKTLNMALTDSLTFCLCVKTNSA